MGRAAAFRGLRTGPWVIRPGRYYVAPWGNDSNVGSFEKPFLTITKAADTATAGQEVYIRGGTYAESATLDTNAGTAANPILFTAFPGEYVYVYLDGNDYAVSIRKNYLIVRGLVARTTGTSATIIFKEASYCQVLDCEVIQPGGVGIYVVSSAVAATSGNLISRCYVHNGAQEGIYFKVDSNAHNAVANNIAERCLIASCAYEGVQNTTGDTTLPTGSIFRYNRITGCADYAGGGDLAGNVLFEGNVVWANVGSVGGVALGTGSDGAIIRNNLIYANAGTSGQRGLRIGNNCVNTKVYHNTIYGNAGTGIYEALPTATLEIKNNICSGNTDQHDRNGSDSVVNTNIFYGTTSSAGSNRINQDPLFVDPANGNFHLQAASPAHNAGLNLSVLTDLMNLARDATPDVGCFEDA